MSSNIILSSVLTAKHYSMTFCIVVFMIRSVAVWDSGRAVSFHSLTHNKIFEGADFAFHWCVLKGEGQDN